MHIRSPVLQLCSIRQIVSWCTFILLSALLFSAAQLSEAHELHGLLRHTQMPSHLSASGNLCTADILCHKIPEVMPICTDAYAVLDDQYCQMTSCFEAESLYITVAGVTNPAGHQPLVSIDSIQNEPAFSLEPSPRRCLSSC